MAPAFVFRPMQLADLPLIARWLGLPHVSRWWGNPAEQSALISNDLTEPAMDQYIVMAHGSPFAYLQCYSLAAWNCGFGEQPIGTRGIDLFIGELGMIGHGSALVGSFVKDRLRNGIPRIVTDPDPANGRAIRAYEKAGFARDRLVETADGPALLMVHD
jgi:aminoglycoside 6'-N-acetyltransferase